MATSYSIGKHFEDLIEGLIESGRYSTASEVMREGLRLVEEREERRKRSSKRCARKFRRVSTADRRKKSAICLSGSEARGESGWRPKMPNRLRKQSANRDRSRFDLAFHCGRQRAELPTAG